MAVYKKIQYTITPKFNSEEVIEPIVNNFLVISYQHIDFEFEDHLEKWNKEFKEHTINHIGEFLPGILEMKIEEYWINLGYNTYWIPEDSHTQDLNVSIKSD